jgi:hypothetical protein
MTYAQQPIGRGIRVEHYRLHSVEERPESCHKDAALAAIHSALHRVEMGAQESPRCTLCTSKRTRAVVLEFPAHPQRSPIGADGRHESTVCRVQLTAGSQLRRACPFPLSEAFIGVAIAMIRRKLGVGRRLRSLRTANKRRRYTLFLYETCDTDTTRQEDAHCRARASSAFSQWRQPLRRIRP